MPADADDLNAIEIPLKPALLGKALRRRLALSAPLAAFVGLEVALALTTSSARGQLVAGAIGLGAGVLIGALLFVLVSRNARLLVGPSTISIYDSFGRRRSFSRYDVAQLKRFGTAMGSARVGMTFVLAHDTRVLGRIDGEVDLERISQTLRVPITGSWDEVVTAGRLRRLYPGSVSWVEAHALLVGFMLTPVILLAIGLYLLYVQPALTAAFR